MFFDSNHFPMFTMFENDFNEKICSIWKTYGWSHMIDDCSLKRTTASHSRFDINTKITRCVLKQLNCVMDLGESARGSASADAAVPSTSGQSKNKKNANSPKKYIVDLDIVKKKIFFLQDLRFKKRECKKLGGSNEEYTRWYTEEDGAVGGIDNSEGEYDECDDETSPELADYILRLSNFYQDLAKKGKFSNNPNTFHASIHIKHDISKNSWQDVLRVKIAMCKR